MTMSNSRAPEPETQGPGRTYLDKLRLAAQVILDAAPDGNLVPAPLEVELNIFKDRVEFMLLLPEALPEEPPAQSRRRTAAQLKEEPGNDG